MDFTRLHRPLLGFTGFELPKMVCTGLNKVVLGFTGFRLAFAVLD